MRGDRLIIKEIHTRAAEGIVRLVDPLITEQKKPFVLAIAGESGSGKSEIAQALIDRLTTTGTRCLILQQDDYFVYPPKTNEKMRRRNISHVGVSEVNLERLDHNLARILAGDSTIQKPLVIFDEDRIVTEAVEVKGVDLVIIEGTYTSLLRNVHCRAFIERTWEETRESRRERAREKQDGFLEQVLEIEHRIISSHRRTADLLVNRKYEVERQVKNDE